ncbi:hypothetical protein TTHERM_000209398 (macronuclear) [Tetrahymena thermophila SB210]|uniref:Kinase domain protein n=1 Tax=Tetrahymena thermophila (strain SB210) TaxID=312017 RepID=W7XLP8_TETTS|nr:hypothetical protein TTHERM_000209398 [Tetrahymena thermophila SB210]EWS76664.1 hypothetical protein TTHERM_000209398 [Tetrahymena thermophila SB210]|eukprot:XP_012650832.1 hypothetical protein TTHERM_000209398 [Tetrahymena thermophila SB210]
MIIKCTYKLSNYHIFKCKFIKYQFIFTDLKFLKIKQKLKQKINLLIKKQNNLKIKINNFYILFFLIKILKMINQENQGTNRFNLVYDYIDERDLSQLEPVVKCIPTLSSFELRFNNYSRIGKKGTQKISEALSISQKMNSFKLYLNQLRIGNEAIETLSQGISNCLNLQSIVLNLHDNMMNCQTFQKLCEQISKCKQLRALDLDVSKNYILSNEQSSQALQIIFTMIPNLKFLSLNLRQNKLETSNKTPCLFIYLYKCINLEYLCLNLEQLVQINSNNNFQLSLNKKYQEKLVQFKKKFTKLGIQFKRQKY